MQLKYESTLNKDIVDGLHDLGHEVVDNGGAGSVVGVVARNKDGKLVAKADFRKSGGVAGFWEL